jgi:hypothetical protein
MTKLKNVLDSDVSYPLYDGEGQRKAYQEGKETHKTPEEMNRHERRMVLSRLAKE